MPSNPLFARFAERLATAVKEDPETFDKEITAFIGALRERERSGQAKVQAISPADLSGLTNVGVQIGRAILSTGKQDLTYVERMASFPNTAVRCCAAMALGEFGNSYPQKIIPLAYQLSQDSAWEVREFIANAFDERMSQDQGDFVYKLMEQWVHDANENVRRVPTNALMRYGRQNPERVLKLMETLRADPSMYVRKNVCFCLGVIGLERHPLLGHPDSQNPQRVMKLLQQWIQEDNERTHWIIAETSGRAWSKALPEETFLMLRQLGESPYKSVVSAVNASLKAICKRDPTARERMRAWLDEDSPRVRELAQKLL